MGVLWSKLRRDAVVGPRVADLVATVRDLGDDPADLEAFTADLRALDDEELTQAATLFRTVEHEHRIRPGLGAVADALCGICDLIYSEAERRKGGVHDS